LHRLRGSLADGDAKHRLADQGQEGENSSERYGEQQHFGDFRDRFKKGEH